MLPGKATSDSSGPSRPRRAISRREFLARMGVLAAGILASACRARRTPVSATPTSAPAGEPSVVPSTSPTPSPAPTATATPTAAALPGSPAPVPSSVPLATPTPVPPPRVAIARAASYDPALVREQVRALLDGLGGLGDVVSPGDRVAIKVNLTGGANFRPPTGFLATESYMTHPEVVRALGEALRDAGARELYIVEAIYDPASYRTYGYVEVAADLEATLLDLNAPDPYADFVPTPVGAGWLMYETFDLNPILAEVDAFVSVAKMKCHYNAGITLSMKNLVGLVPVTHYRQSQADWWRSGLHGGGDLEAGRRLPRVIVDLNRARPIHLALIDGIKTGEGGEAPRGSFAPVQPGVLVAGKSAVATDAVGAAVMGFDPTVEPPTAPFLRADNYLNLARGLKLGTNLLEEIEVAGAAIDKVLYPFQPSVSM